MSPKHHAEIDDKLIGHLRKLSSEQLKAALEELRRSKKFVRGTKGNQLAVPTIIQTEDVSTQFALTALVALALALTSMLMCCMTVGLWPSGIFSFYIPIYLLSIV